HLLSPTLMLQPHAPTLFPYTTLFRSATGTPYYDVVITRQPTQGILIKLPYTKKGGKFSFDLHHRMAMTEDFGLPAEVTTVVEVLDRKSTRLNSSHGSISYAVFCLKKK